MKQLRSCLAVTCSLLLFALGGCSTANKVPRGRAVPASAKNVPRPPAPAETSFATATYFAQVTALDLFQLRAADIALQLGSARTKSLAIASKRQHQAIAAQLAFAGRRLNLLPSRALPTEYEQMLTALTWAANFDGIYLSQQEIVTRRALNLHSNYARNGKSATLRPVAKFAVQAVDSELRLLRQ